MFFRPAAASYDKHILVGYRTIATQAILLVMIMPTYSSEVAA